MFLSLEENLWLDLRPVVLDIFMVLLWHPTRIIQNWLMKFGGLVFCDFHGNPGDTLISIAIMAVFWFP